MARGSRIEIGTAITMRREPAYMVEDGAADLLVAVGRSLAQPGHRAGDRRLALLRLPAADGETDADMARHTGVLGC